MIVSIAVVKLKSLIMLTPWTKHCCERLVCADSDWLDYASAIIFINMRKLEHANIVVGP